MNLEKYITLQKAWSETTFGPGPRTGGIIEHIKAELEEIADTPSDIFEWIDVVILALDGAWRAGYTPEQICEKLQQKQGINFIRKWPPPGPQNKANMHIE